VNEFRILDAADADVKSNKADAMAAVLRHEIAVGRRPPGSELPPEGQLTRQYGISRSSYREAMRVLESEGLIKVTRGPRGGAKVLMPPAEPLTRYVGILLQMQHVPIEAYFQMRGIYEPAAVRAIATRSDQAALGALAQCAHAQEFAVHDRPAFNEHERKFRRTLIEYSGNPILILMGSILEDLYDRYILNASRREPTLDFATEHLDSGIKAKQRLVKLMAAGDADRAASAWETYISVSWQRFAALVGDTSLFEIFSDDDPPPDPARMPEVASDAGEL
jgi:DNA-binding FadR family transcriptional regulator